MAFRLSVLTVGGIIHSDSKFHNKQMMVEQELFLRDLQNRIDFYQKLLEVIPENNLAFYYKSPL